MTDFPDNYHRQSCTSDSVVREVEIAGEDGTASNSSGLIDNSLFKHGMSRETSTTGKSDSSSSHQRKSGRSEESHNLRILAAKLFDDRVPFRKKLKLFRKIANVKDDGTAQLEEPCYTTEPPDIPPLQIVMLIVGTRGNVQPFIAIGKHLQFFPLGGDPKVLAGYMVKNKGFLPSVPSEIPIQRHQIRDIIFSLCPACEEPDPETNIPFKADAIIANPPAYGHTHVAEKLKIPIHIFFTMPWTPTCEFPHPLSLVKQPVAYKLSYQIVDSMIWLGIRDMINEFRKKKLKLRPITYLSGYYSSPLDLPYGYIWSPNLVPKPKESNKSVYLLDNCPHDWLFSRCKAVVHHGGAGTTAAGLKAACPTTIVPFFGDQPFWGEQVHARGVGPAPIPAEEFSLPKLVEAIKFMLDPKVGMNSFHVSFVIQVYHSALPSLLFIGYAKPR
uniref:Uncharacterized protein n=1 Tax=Manihot esculenta TaxID=3983 RepID=A0A2C9VF44_MANES